MKEPGGHNFHLLMAALLFTSLVIDQQELATWRAGKVSMVSLAMAMVWIGRFTFDGFRRRDAARRVLKNRVQDLEDRLDQVERDAKSRRAPF